MSAGEDQTGVHSLIDELAVKYRESNEACLITPHGALRPRDVIKQDEELAEKIAPGDVVALIGDFDECSIRRMLTIIDRRCMYVPLTEDTRPQHGYFFDAAMVDVVVDGNEIKRIRKSPAAHPMLDEIRRRNHAGLVLFSSGTTGAPKAILHDFERFLVRFRTPRPTLRTLNFLLFDHIGGVNTLFHTLFNGGVVVFPSGRRPSDVVRDIRTHDIEVLPTTPSFLRMLLMSGLLEEGAMPTLKVITYGTERMDEPSLVRLCEALPDVDFRQTFGMSELGILRVKSVARDSLWMHVGGEGVELKVVGGVLKIRAKNKMIGYLNAASPFDEEGWYDTKDIVEQRDDGAIRVVGRTTEWISIGGEKILPETIEKAALAHPDVLRAKAVGASNPITGQHIDLTCQLRDGAEVDKSALKTFLRERLPASFIPQRIAFGEVRLSHRFKQT